MGGTPAWTEGRSMEGWMLRHDGKRWQWWHPGLPGKAPPEDALVEPCTWECVECGHLEEGSGGGEEPPSRFCCPPGTGPKDWPDDFWTRLDESVVGPRPAVPVTDAERRACLEEAGQARLPL